VPARLIAEWSGRIIAQGRQGVGAISTLQFLPRILTRSLHLPVAVVEGSLTQNLNKTAVPSEAIPPGLGVELNPDAIKAHLRQGAGYFDADAPVGQAAGQRPSMELIVYR
jgi:hypothetical protein